MTELSAATPTPRRRLPALVVVLGILILFVGGLLAVLLIKPPQKFLCDQPAPDFTLKMFDQYRGGWQNESLKLSDLRGKGVVLNFWASWCQPCAEEAAALENSWKQYKSQGIEFVGVDYYDQEPVALGYLQKFAITYPNGPDLAGAASKVYAIKGVPETFFINPEGKIMGCRVEGPLTPDELGRRIAQILPK
jgi:cytochrome c biogenesis protein CcmG/thiol:disulfide interchange protein DsbE